MQILLSYSLQGMLESRLSLHDRRACWVDDDIKFQLENVVIANAFSRGLTKAEEILINKRFFVIARMASSSWLQKAIFGHEAR